MELQAAEMALTRAREEWEAATEEMRKLTRQDTQDRIAKVRRRARDARSRYMHAMSEFIDAHLWRLGQ